MGDTGTDGKQMLENATKDAALDAMPSRKDLLSKDALKDAASEPKKTPPGCVERVLNFRDRNMLISAARAFCEKADKKKIKDREKLDRLSKVIVFEETIDYFLMIQDDIEEKVISWRGAREKYKLWRQYKEGLLKPEDEEEFRKRFPEVDLQKGPEKPPVRAPEITPEENRGPKRSFYFPARLDVWVQDVLRATDWDTPTAMAELVVELCEKFDIKDDGPSS